MSKLVEEGLLDALVDHSVEDINLELMTAAMETLTVPEESSLCLLNENIVAENKDLGNFGSETVEVDVKHSGKQYLRGELTEKIRQYRKSLGGTNDIWSKKLTNLYESTEKLLAMAEDMSQLDLSTCSQEEHDALVLIFKSAMMEFKMELENVMLKLGSGLGKNEAGLVEVVQTSSLPEDNGWDDNSLSLSFMKEVRIFEFLLSTLENMEGFQTAVRMKTQQELQSTKLELRIKTQENEALLQNEQELKSLLKELQAKHSELANKLMKTQLLLNHQEEGCLPQESTQMRSLRPRSRKGASKSSGM